MTQSVTTTNWNDIFKTVVHVNIPILFVDRINFDPTAENFDEKTPSLIIPQYGDENILKNQFIDLLHSDKNTQIVFKFDKIIEAVEDAYHRYTKKFTN